MDDSIDAEFWMIVHDVTWEGVAAASGCPLREPEM
jgi:hypothetical protein